MKNPWLNIPVDDYEGHMSSPAVAQLQTLSELFAGVLKDFLPKSLVVFGCATGNGFEHIDSSVTKRIVGVDINPAYLQVLQKRFLRILPNLDLIEQDFASPVFWISPVEMAFAALVFEYVPVDHAIRNISNSLVSGGILVAALQLPSTVSGLVTKTEFSSIETLGSIMTLVAPDNFSHVCSANGLDLKRERTIPLKQGKALFVGHYRKRSQ
jgi:SAM-dependent methyltransferase